MPSHIEKGLATATGNLLPPFTVLDEENDLSAAHRSTKEQEEMDGILREANELLAQEGTSTEEKKEEAEADDPLGIRLLSGAGAFVKDVGMGIGIEAIPQVVGGAVSAVNNTLSALDSLGEWLNGHADEGGNLTFEDLGPVTSALLSDDPKEEVKIALPEVDPASSVTGGVIRAFSQFFTGFLPMLKTVRLFNGGRKLAGLGGVAQVEISGAAAAALVFDPHEERLSNLIQSMPILQNPVNEYLAADPSDTEAEGRFKNAIEGLGFAIFAEGTLRALKSIKLNRVDKGVKFDEAISLNDEAFKQKIRDGLGGDKDTGFISDDAAEAFLRGERKDSFSITRRIDIEGERLLSDREHGIQDTEPFDVFEIKDPKGQSIGEMTVSFSKDGTDARIEMIEVGGGSLAVGNSGVRQILDQLIVTHPKLKTVSGERITGARVGVIDSGGIAASSVEVEIPIGRSFEKAAQGSVETLAFQMNWAQFTSSENVAEALEKTALLFSRQIDEARRGTITDDALRALA